MTQKYPGGFVTLTPPTLDPALGAATQGIWTLDQALTAAKLRSWPMYDPYYRNVVLNLHGDGTNGAQNNTFLDSSTNNFTITRNGNTTQGTFSPYGPSWSNYFGSASGDVGLYMNGESAFAFGTGDFTIEMWVNLQSVAGLQDLIDFRPSSTQGLYPTLYIDTPTSTLRYYTNSADRITGTTAFTYNTWHHVAVTRSGTSTKVFLDGVQQGSTYTDTNNYLVGTNRPYTGYGVNASGYMMYGGYLSNLRITKGQALYTSTFTPPTEPLTTTSQGATAANVSLLTAQSNRFVDNSSNGFTVNVTGTVSVQRFQPFLFNTSYTPSTIGGSGYFDGTGDYLNTATSANLAVGSGNMTIECWFYPLVPPASRQQWLFDFRTSGSESTTRLYAYIGESDGILYAGFGGFDDQSSGTPIKNAWNHMAIVRSGSGSNNVAVYLNGTRTKQLTDTTNFSTSTQAYVGKRYLTPGSIEYMVGYLCDTRFVKGTAVYDPSVSTLTLPTAPLTAVTNTQLLLGYTNSGIVDNAMMNDLETVGNAQISTSVKKYGTGSMYFDGTGDYLKSPFVTPQNLGTGDFTIEMWAYFSSVTSVGLLAKGTNSGNAWQGYNVFVSSGTINFETNDTQSDSATGVRLSSSTTVTTGQWYHIAFVRQSGTTKIYLNGTSVASGSNSGSCDNSYGFRVGISRTGHDLTMNGYIDDLRITKGVARYVANFTPPTSQLQDQ